MISFMYGTVGCGKSNDLLINEKLLHQDGVTTLIIKPAVSCPDKCYKGYAPFGSLAVNPGRLALYVDSIDVEQILATRADTIFIDQAHFFKASDIDALIKLSDSHKKDVWCYGLKTDYKGNLFETASKLLACADTIREVRKIPCSVCGKRPATHNVRYAEKDLGYEDMVQPKTVAHNKFIFKPTCRECWRERT